MTALSLSTAQQIEGLRHTWDARPSEGDTSMLIYAEQFPQPIARVLSYSSRQHGPGRHERDKYARLIAAAPELLAALKALDAYWLESLPDGPDGSRQVMSGLGTIADDTIAIWKQARTAIAKATQP